MWGKKRDGVVEKPWRNLCDASRVMVMVVFCRCEELRDRDGCVAVRVCECSIL